MRPSHPAINLDSADRVDHNGVGRFAVPRHGEFFAIPTAESSMQSRLRRHAVVPFGVFAALVCGLVAGSVRAEESAEEVRFFEQKIRPLLVRHCYECHSEEAGEQQGGLLLDRRSGWIEGGDTDKAVVPGQPDASLLVTAIRYDDANLQMPPDQRLDDEAIALFEQWVQRGAIGPADDMGETEFSRLGDQEYLFDQAADHWAFQPVTRVTVPSPPSSLGELGRHAVDHFVADSLAKVALVPSEPADPATLLRRLHYDLTGLPPTYDQITAFVEAAEIDRDAVTRQWIDRLIASPEFGQHLGRLWLDVVRYGDTDNNYRPDTRTPHYHPFAFSYRDYVVRSLNDDKPFDQFLKEQMAADLMGFAADAPEMAALGFYASGPYSSRAQAEALDDWIDVTTRGLMGITAACARCHDHKFEPVPTADYYSLRGVFAAAARVDPLDETKQPVLASYRPTPSETADYQKKRAAIDAKVNGAAGKKAKNNNRSIAQKIRETELAELLTFHPGAPARAMVLADRKRPPESYVFIRGDASARGDAVPRRFLKILDPQQGAFPADSSGRLELAEKIASADNPLTARVFVNRVWGHLIGSHLVATPSDFGLQGSRPTHPELLDWLADDFMRHGWSVKHLVRRIVTSQTYQQSSRSRDAGQAADPENRWLWRSNRKHLSIEAIRDSMLLVAGQLDRRIGGHPGRLWDGDYTRRRAIYGFINRFNLDPTLRAFDFPAPVQTQPARGESIVAPQALFTMNAPLVIDQAAAIASSAAVSQTKDDRQKVVSLFQMTLGRDPDAAEITRTLKFVEFQKRFQNPDRPPTRFIDSPWPLIAQALLMSNEFQYVD
ncbi:Planctomycete cytochrome C [Stieleria maiorica]|uniref:Planctomycete cytochrome C n=1 Tax=Stieleria maiorica TaxID=2795974 RepID=A0A5B9MK81_9BACT|nr:Planctomycete cytochrome C [Stieleria maiorica]